MLFNLKNAEEKQQMIAMIKEYRNTIQPGITAQLQEKFKPSEHRKIVEQTTFAWFSKEHIAALLDQSDSVNGIRVYFAAHDQSTVSDTGTEYQGQLTVVLVSTESNAAKEGGMKSSDIVDGFALDRGSLCRNDCPPTANILLVP